MQTDTMVSVMFGKLFAILNSTTNRLNTEYYSHNLLFLEEFLMWFKMWKLKCVNRMKCILPVVHTAYQAMTGFFTAEASDDCITMVEGIINLTKYYCSINVDTNYPVLRPQNKSSTFALKKTPDEGGMHTGKVHKK